MAGAGAIVIDPSLIQRVIQNEEKRKKAAEFPKRRTIGWAARQYKNWSPEKQKAHKEKVTRRREKR
jgi:hypothetical protein